MDIEGVVLDVFARSLEKARTRLLRIIVRVGTFVMRVLLTSVSLRGSHIPPILPFFGKLTCRSFCRCAPSSRPHTFRLTYSRAPYG